jgi:hypothetical protein
MACWKALAKLPHAVSHNLGKANQQRQLQTPRHQILHQVVQVNARFLLL